MSHERPRLPSMQRHAMWHNESGLIVSPFSRILPSTITLYPPPGAKKKPHTPRILNDDELYMAFFPKKPIHHGPIFSVLAVTPHELVKTVGHVQGTASSFVLERGLMKKWIGLEDSLHDVIFYLMTKHPKARFFPEIKWPMWPIEQGYREAHSSPEFTVVCAKRAMWSFRVMAACTTFALSLWLGEYETTCFQDAFSKLATRTHNPISRSWLHLLQESVVGDLSPGLRPGGFLNPYTTRWGPFMTPFCRASVPIWFLWGHDSNYTSAEDANMVVEFYPPPDYIEVVKRRVAHYDSLVLPTKGAYKFSGDLSAIPSTGETITLPNPSDNFELTSGNDFWDDKEPSPSPVDRSMVVNPLSGQRPGENWEAFKARKEGAQERRIQVETPVEKQSCESREAHAIKSGPSKTSTVYVWEVDEIDPTVYRRTVVTKAEASYEYSQTYSWEQFYWSYCNEWDLVRHIDPPPGEKRPDKYGANLVYDDDVDYEGIGSGSTILQTPLGEVSEMFKHGINSTPSASHVLSLHGLVEYLRRRHGFDVLLQGYEWTPALHRGKYVQNVNQRSNVLRFLLQDEGSSIPTSSSRALINFYNILVNDMLSYRDLPPPWDIGIHPANLGFICDLSIVRLQRIVETDVTTYILRPAAASHDRSPWYIALWSATAVLQVYRRRWVTMLEIARSFLELGIPFRTVVEADRRPRESLWKGKSTGLGFRPGGYRPNEDDYNAYLLARDAIFSSSRGRVLRMLGGIVWRLASGIVPDSAVLDGPSMCDEVVARHGNKYFLDDGVTQEMLDIVCGVYHVPVADNQGTIVHASWWPKHFIWKTSGLCGDQWSPAAKNFYQKQMSILDNKKWEIKGSSKWKASTRNSEGKTSAWIHGSEYVAAEFLRRSSRVR